MSPRHLSLSILALGFVVVGWLVFVRSAFPPPRSISAAPASATASQTAAPVPPALPRPAAFAPDAQLEALLAATDARANEATLAFKDAAAYRRFLARARAVLTRLETRRDQTGGIAAGVDSLPLFATPAAPSGDELREKLASIDPDNITPREALDLLTDLKALAGQAGDVN